MMDRGRTEREYNGHTRGDSLTYVVLLMTLSIVLSNGYMAIPRYNMRATLNSRHYMEAQLSSETIHRSLCEAVNSGESPAMNLIWQSFQEDCDRLREELDEMMDEEEAEKGEDREPKVEASSLEEGMDVEEDTATEEDTIAEEDVAAEEKTRWERYPYHALGNREYMVHRKRASEDPGVIDDDAVKAPATDSPTATDTTLTAQPLKSLAMIHIWVVSSGYSSSLMADIASDNRDGPVMTIRKPYRSSRGDGPGVKVYLNGNGVYRYYEGS